MKRMLQRRMAGVICLTLLAALFWPGMPIASSAADPEKLPKAEETSSEPVQFVKDEGSIALEFTDVNAAAGSFEGKADYLALFTSGATVTDAAYEPVSEVRVAEGQVAVTVDAEGIVQEVVGPLDDPPTTWDAERMLPIPEGGYLVLAGGKSSWDESAYRPALFQEYHLGDQVKLMRAGVEVTAADFIPATPDPDPEPAPEPPPAAEPEPEPDPDPEPALPELMLLTEDQTIVDIPVIEVAGFVANYDEQLELGVTVNGDQVELSADGVFRENVYLSAGANAVTVILLQAGEELEREILTIMYEPSENQDYIEVEAAPKDISIDIDGPRIKIDYVDKDVTGVPNIVALFTRDYGESIEIPQFNVAVQVDANNRVLQVINPSINGQPPVWTGPTLLEIPEEGYVLMAQDDSYAGNYIKRFLAENFKAGDIIKLRKNGEVVSVRDLMSGNGPIARLKVNNQRMYTVTEDHTILSGIIENIDDPAAIQLLVNGTSVPFEADGSFSYSYPLTKGTNYIEMRVLKNEIEQDRRDLAVFARDHLASDKEVILWVDQASNAKKFQTSEQVRAFLQKAKDSGVTSIALDVKGVEGYVSYKKNDLTGRPYVSELQAPGRAGANPDLDLLQEFIDHGHDLGLEIHAVVNVFAEGSIAYNEYAVLNDHLDWEERVHYAENNGEIKRLRESAKQGLVAFVNPANDEVREFELKTFEEILKNYDVDGVVHDRGRYDNEGADFSEETRVKFEQFLLQRGKQLNDWPNDIFYYENNVRVDGPLIQDWWEFRSGVIQSFFGEVKSLVDSYEAGSGRTIKVSSYVGSWYETYYLNGVNWASKNFRIHPSLGLPVESIYTPEYYDTGYIEYLDFLMIGAYQTTSQEIQKYITLGNIVTNGEIPLYAGIALNNVQLPAVQREVFQAGLRTTNGLMLFDASQINWAIAKASLEDREWVKDYQLGMSLPDRPDTFLEGHYYNVNRVEGNINVLTDAFGTTTGTNHFGVEVVVDDTGVVTRVANRNQAINWSWGAPEENNSVIPPGGFVISTIDPSGVRTNRQLVANAYEVGDQVRSAVLSGLMDDALRETRDSHYPLEGTVEVLGPGMPSVKVNGESASVTPTGTFSANVPLSPGINFVQVDVYVDDLKTNSQTVQIIRTSTGDGGSNPGQPGSSGGSSSGTTPTQPVKPERLDVVKTTAENGQHLVDAKAELSRMLEEVKSLQTKPAQSQQLQYSFTESADVLTLHLPTAGLEAAVKELPNGVILLESPLVGRLELPVQALSESLQLRGSADSLQIRLSLPAKAQEEELYRLLPDQAAPLGSLLEVSFFWEQDDTLTELPAFKGANAKFTAAPLSGSVSAGTTTVLLLQPSLGSYTFVPAVIKEEGGKAQITFRLKASGIYAAIAHRKTFTDLNGHWAADEVGMLASKTVIQGTSDTEFSPNAPITRAQFTAMLVRALGLTRQQPNPSGGFTDVNPGAWYASAVSTALEHGLIEGFAGGEFRPNEQITRQQMSVLLVRALKLAGAEVPLGNPSSTLAGFEDRSQIGAWAKEAAAIAVESGLMKGRGDGDFAPEASSTRAEAATVLARMLRMAGLINP
ncbi:S-layer homology domain-containing protein [Paenibacillus phoenicis]|uniref:S-layer homology domain-containing protein n=1 Tax=Paenibacillus phoenicis TaxID=554117 RepID=A0ABU5PGX9_9BACL|nr:S-layer homology domain-containing protein [Paenibacillus phoenicis]MEA3569135.1 S-layer homology domain-containing protein [Paenibacillus phoenicis]